MEARRRAGPLRRVEDPVGTSALTWADILWDENKIRVRSPKTEHHEGKDERLIPLFAELRPYLNEAWDQAEEGAVHVIARYRDGNAKLRTRLLNTIKRAGVTTWPRLFSNLQSSRQTELGDKYPSHVVCAWMGNSEAVANAHYLQMRESYFESAVGGGAESGAGSVGHGKTATDRIDATPYGRGG